MRTIGTSLLLGLAVACCAPAVATTTTTGAAYAPSSPAAREDAELLRAEELPPVVHFAVGTDALLAGEPDRLHAWAGSLARPELAHTTIVLAGADEPDAPVGLFAARAARIRAELVARGVASERVVVAAPPVTPLGPKTGTVRLVLSGDSTVRDLAPPVDEAGGQGRGRSVP